ncbi:hypothetical protein JOF56_009935 [Kibdelosporangium banguiense]|uniref:Uncharacterized protein n=1 Tax=Kibdelosporangium banguiense TaxID=1365924 RepID=A0ABS4TYT1_9PSEU|nr:hypothetical protein [Kibdelosporangium banguiense]
MRDHSTTIEHWLGLAHPDLTEHVRRAVRGGSTATAPWSEVAAHPVLAARARGILSALQSQMADHRDHAMWTLWINTARRALNTIPTPTPINTQPTSATAPSPAEQLPAITIATTPPPRSQRHTVPPVTFLTAGQMPTNSTEQ